jgi:hypothetical protein
MQFPPTYCPASPSPDQYSFSMLYAKYRKLKIPQILKYLEEIWKYKYKNWDWIKYRLQKCHESVLKNAIYP